ncbi:hypothetical protein HN385_00495 [archaeon]|jgi:hypothetical protein|nr:hypothetical protein [archaeon]MBT3451598.1 hypothetical protein [archaeon]MBT6869618.1 hypothetical protein [archaeon]MBT7192387.1 hypothetical protein [archaeon]MBT7380188.1 hypothetical protein [archaeon]
MADTLILAVQNSSYDDIPVYYRPVLCWDQEKGDKGYHSIDWKESEDTYLIERKFYLTGRNSEIQAGADLNEVISRNPSQWFWAKDTNSLFPGAEGFYMKKSLQDKLESLSDSNIFDGIITSPELYDRDVILGFGDLKQFAIKQVEWYELFRPEADKILCESLKSNDYTTAYETTRLLMQLSCHFNDDIKLDVKLRNLISHPPNDKDRVMQAAYKIYPFLRTKYSNVGQLKEAMNKLHDELILGDHKTNLNKTS